MVKRRKCSYDDCDTTLSRSNKGEYCYAHTPGNPVYIYTSSKATSYEEPKLPTDPQPGKDGYNDRAFIKICIGFINEDGEFEPIENLLEGNNGR